MHRKVVDFANPVRREDDKSEMLLVGKHPMYDGKYVLASRAGYLFTVNSFGEFENYGGVRVENVPQPPVFRPWKTIEEVPMLKEIRSKSGSDRAIISGVSRVNDRVYVKSAGFANNGEYMLENWTMADGSPCGVKTGRLEVPGEE